ncbi:MAG TPA: GAF domain-containing sensor histidine kinase [Longimicrobiales bacterium]|nr:GAF domain-containing sensor histidine kinase [Longimicrobiales bacterium]
MVEAIGTRDGAQPHARELTGAAFLADASRLLADSLDYETTLATVAGMALPHLGAWCIVDVVDPDGSLRRLAIVHPDPDKQALARKLHDGWPPRRDDPLGVPAVMLTHGPEVIPQVTEDLLREAARSPANLEILRRLGIGSLMILPLVARNEVLGAITFVAPTDGHAYGAADLGLARDLAARCAIAIDNARLYREAQAARAEAEEASRAKSQLLAMTSHEIRTPINAIVGYAQLLDMGLDGPLTVAQRRKLERIQASGQYLLGLVNRILDTARAERGQLSVQSEPVELADVVDSAVSIVQPQAAERSLCVEVDLDGVAPRFAGDPIRARQVLVNLLVNACKFTDPGGRISLHADSTTANLEDGRPVRWTRLHVDDNGAGIPAEQLERIFEPFVQVDPELTRSVGGAGLGLAISRELARMMGGDLTVESRLGNGSRFTLWLRSHEQHDAAQNGAANGLPDRPDLQSAAEIIMRRIVPIVDGYIERLKADPSLSPVASDFELRDTAFTLLSVLADLLAASGEYGSDPMSGAIRDGGSIHRFVSELHGAQRQRIGWGEDDLGRDYAALRDAVTDELRRFAPPGLGVDATAELVGRVLERAERASRRGWHSATSRDA